MNYDEMADFLLARSVDDSTTIVMAGVAQDVVDWYQTYRDSSFPDLEGGYALGSEMAMAFFARLWRSHPDYRPEWA